MHTKRERSIERHKTVLHHWAVWVVIHRKAGNHTASRKAEKVVEREVAALAKLGVSHAQIHAELPSGY